MPWRSFTTNDGLAGHEAGDGDTLVVALHGGPGMTDYTVDMCEEILAADPSLRVARYQQRGQAPSTTDGPLTIDQFVDDVVAVINHFGAATAVVAGHSWGAHLAMHVAADQPDRVRALLLIDPLGAVDDGGVSTMQGIIRSRLSAASLEALDGLPALDLEADDASRREIALLWPGYFAEPSAAPAIPDDLLITASVGASLWPSMAQRFDEDHLASRLPRFAKPVLYQIGTASPIDPSVNARSAKLFPSVIVDELDCGHFPWLERPGSVTRATQQLLAVL